MRSPLTGSPRRKSYGPIAAVFAADGSGPVAPQPVPDRRDPAVGDRRHQSWRELAVTAACLTFETDAEGVFTFVDPGPALGWTSATLLGKSGDLILAEVAGVSAFNPFRPLAAARHRRCWIRRADGSIACLSFSVMPLTERDGRITGARGMAIDLSELDGTEAGVAAALRRADVLDHMLRGLRVELLPERMTQQALRSLANMLGAEGALVVDASPDTAPPNAAQGASRTLLHEVGGDPGSVLTAACEHLRFALDTKPVAAVIDGRPMLVCPCPTRFGGQAGLVLWRRSGARHWDTHDLAIVASAASLIRVVLEHGTIQSELATQARTDALTGLVNRRAFLEEVGRRIDRLDRDRQPGTMMVIDLDNFRALNERLGHDVGDEALRIATALLRVTFRPADVLTRLGGDAFAVWMDSADEMTAAERADALCTNGLQQFAHFGGGPLAITMSIGIAMRWAGADEDAAELSRRADLAVGLVKRAGGGGWRVWHAEK